MLAKQLLTIAALVATATALPVHAQSHQAAGSTPETSYRAQRGEDYRPRVDVLINNLNQLSGAIATARKNGTITQTEAEGIRTEVRSTRQAISSHSKDGITRTEFQELAQRVNAIRTKLRMERVEFDRAQA